MPCHLKILLAPRSSRDCLVGFQGDELKIKISAPPVDGAANEALVKFLAGLLGLKRQSLSLIAGQSGRRKIMKIDGLDEDELRRRLNAHLKEPI